MALSPGARQAGMLAAGWVAAAGFVVLGIVYLGEIKAVMGGALGLQRNAAAQKIEGAEQRVAVGRIVELKAGAHGHYRASAEINGRPVDVMVDTGASMVALSYDDARRAGIYVRDGDFRHRVSTANGFARVASITIDRISIGNITVRNVPGAVLEAGKLDTSLLGMSFLARLQRVDMRGGILVLQE
jgi:aspartyl protease family protein